MAHRTPLYEAHREAGAKLVDFAGWEMPIHYGSQLEEHHKVRRDAGLFDVSHMAAVDLEGDKAEAFLRYLLANDVAKLQASGKALYSCMLNEQGGVIDDLIVYYRAPQSYRVIVNAGTRTKDIAWFNQRAEKYNVMIRVRTDLAILAVQGPNARSKAEKILLPERRAIVAALKPFHFTEFDDCLIARTGYTGEDGLEIMLPATQVVDLWRRLLQVGVSPCGLGARDTLRLEAGLNLYGADMDESTTPFESNLAWTVAMEPATREFIGRQALEQRLQRGVQQVMCGLILTERGILRAHQQVITENGTGEITSGTFSPTLGYAIALARVPANIGAQCQVNIRDKLFSVRVIKPPFVRNGQQVFA